MLLEAGTDEGIKAAALEREFEASMQAVMAAIALDAFYAILLTACRAARVAYRSLAQRTHRSLFTSRRGDSQSVSAET